MGKLFFYLICCGFVVAAQSYHVQGGRRLPNPEFMASPSYVTVREGDVAVLPCIVKHLGTREVAWITRSQFLTFGTLSWTRDSRIYVDQPRFFGDVSEWELIISNVTPSDQGVYECLVTSKNRLVKNITLSVEAATTSTTTTSVLNLVPVTNERRRRINKRHVRQEGSSERSSERSSEENWSNEVENPSCLRCEEAGDPAKDQLEDIMERFDMKAIYPNIQLLCGPRPDCWDPACNDTFLKMSLEVYDSTIRWICDNRSGFDDASLCFQDPFKDELARCFMIGGEIERTNSNLQLMRNRILSCVRRSLNDIHTCTEENNDFFYSFVSYVLHLQSY